MTKNENDYSLFRGITRVLIFFISCFVFFQSIFSSYQLIQKKSKVYQEEQRLRQVEATRDALKHDIAYAQTDVFIEQEARNKLGLMKIGEHVVYIHNEQPSAIGDVEREELSNQRNISPITQWIMIFFGR